MSEKKENKSEPIRIGVFVCHCGSNIGGLIDCKELAEYAKTLPNVAYAEDSLYTCSETGLAGIKKAINEHNLNRVVVASCTPRTHEPLFRDCIEGEGLNPYLFNFVNIRDQNTWVHMKFPKKAFEKAKDLIRMGVAKSAKLEALDKIIVDANPTALVIGGGISGMTAALSLSNQGFKTYLVEKEDQLGGRLKTLYKLFPSDQEASLIMENLKRKVESNPNLTVYTSSKVKSIEGFIGNYEGEIEQNNNIINLTIGIIVIAVGASLFKPFNLFGYDGKTRITQHELEGKLKNNEIDANDIIMIQCVGARIDERVYCSNVCCMTALKNALIIKEKNPDAYITILFRDLYTPGTYYEDYYRRAREAGIIFIEYSPEKLPTVEEDKIKVFNEYIGEETILPYDLLVLSTPLVANDDNKELAQMLKVPLEENNFFLEAHVKLRPIDFATDGVFICGSAKWPVDITESITQGLAAASRAGTILSHDQIEVEGAISEINEQACVGCEVCIKLCPYNAISKKEEDKVFINKVLCKGCGVCGASCPENAITIHHFTTDQIFSQICSIGESKEREFEPRILGFLCNWCSYAGADLAGVSRIQYSPNIRIIRVMCSGRVDPIFIAEAFSNGIDGILVLGCHIGDCHYISGNYEAEIKMNGLLKLLDLAGFSGRLRLDWVSASEGVRFGQLVDEFTDHIRKLGPSPIKNEKSKENIIDNLNAIKSVLSNSRIRALFARERLITLAGNVYNEVIPEEEFEEILEDAINKEFIRNKILEKIKNKGKSVPEISKEINLEPHLVLSHIVTLRSRGLVDLDKVSGEIPTFISVKE